MPSQLNPVHIYPYHSSIPAHCKYGIGTDHGTDAVYTVAYLLYHVLSDVFLFYFNLFYSTTDIEYCIVGKEQERHFTVLVHVTIKHET